MRRGFSGVSGISRRRAGGPRRRHGAGPAGVTVVPRSPTGVAFRPRVGDVDGGRRRGMALPPDAAFPAPQRPARRKPGARMNETGYSMMNKRLIGAVLLGVAVALVALVAVHAGPVLADQPRPWEMTMQDSATPVHDRLTTL